MKKLFAITLAFLSFATAALAQSVEATPWTETQTLATRATPSATADTGFNLLNVTGFRVSVCAASGQTLTSGTLDAYFFNQRTGAWQRNPSLDLVISVTATSCAGAACRCQVFADQPVDSRAGQVLYAIHSVVCSGGTTADVRIDGWKVPRL